MSFSLFSRFIGVIIFGLIGLIISIPVATLISQPELPTSIVLIVIGVIFGFLFTPYFAKPFKQTSIEALLIGILGGGVGLLMSLLLAFPLSLIDGAIGEFLPAVISLGSALIIGMVFHQRSREITFLFNEWLTRGRGSRIASLSSRKLILDTSVLIDGRIVEVAETGFLGGVLIIPQFVLSELHRVADSSDQLRRNRGRRGLNILNELQSPDSIMPVRIVEDDFDDIDEVDNKLVALGLKYNGALVTNDYNLNQVAEAQGLEVLNVNKLANAVRSIYIPGETFPIKIIQEGKDDNQGVGYLDDGTMVVVEDGATEMNHKIMVTVTKLINRETGRMIFAVRENGSIQGLAS